MHLFSPCQSSCKHGFGHLAYRKGSLLASVCVRLLPTLLAGSPEGSSTLGLLGIFSIVATMRLEKSPNRLWYFPDFREIPASASAINPSYIAVPCSMMDGKMVCRKDGLLVRRCLGRMVCRTTCRPAHLPSCTPTFRHTDLSSSLFQFLIPLSAVRITSNGLWSRLIRSISSLRTALAWYVLRWKARSRTTSILYTVT